MSRAVLKNRLGPAKSRLLLKHPKGAELPSWLGMVACFRFLPVMPTNGEAYITEQFSHFLWQTLFLCACQRKASKVPLLQIGKEAVSVYPSAQDSCTTHPVGIRGACAN